MPQIFYIDPDDLIITEYGEPLELPEEDGERVVGLVLETQLRRVHERRAPFVVSAPVISGDTALGSRLTLADPGVFGGIPAPDTSVQWRKNGVDIDGETGPFLDVPDLTFDVGDSITVRAFGSNTKGTAFVDSAAIVLTAAGTPTAPVVTQEPVIVGETDVGSLIEATTPGAATGFPAPEPEIHWYSDGVDTSLRGSTFDSADRSQAEVITARTLWTNASGSVLSNPSNSITLTDPTAPVNSFSYVGSFEYNGSAVGVLEVPLTGLGPHVAGRIIAVLVAVNQFISGDAWLTVLGESGARWNNIGGVNQTETGTKFYLYVTIDPVNDSDTLQLPSNNGISRAGADYYTAIGYNPGGSTIAHDGVAPSDSVPVTLNFTNVEEDAAILASALGYTQITAPAGMQKATSATHVTGVHIAPSLTASLNITFDLPGTAANKAAFARKFVLTTSPPTDPVAPTNITPPVITGSVNLTGVMSVSSMGEWDGVPAPTLTGEWYVNNVATGVTLVNFDKGAEGIALNDVIEYRVTASNSEGSLTVASNEITITGGTEPQPEPVDEPIHYGEYDDWPLIPNIVVAQYPRLSSVTKFANPSNIQSVVNGLAEGDRVELANGTYPQFEIFNRQWNPNNKPILAARDYGGAIFPQLGLHTITGLTLQGVKTGTKFRAMRFSDLEILWCDFPGATFAYNARSGFLTYSGAPADTDTVNFNHRLLLEKTAIVGTKQLITSASQFDNTLQITRLKNSVIKAVLVARGSGDNLKLRGAYDCLFTEFLTYDTRVPSDIPNLHPDEAQMDGKNAEVNKNCVFKLGAFISGPKVTGTKGGQGLGAGGHPNHNILFEDWISHGSLNSNGFQAGGGPAPVPWRLRRCTTMGFIRGGNPGYIAEDCIIGWDYDGGWTLDGTSVIGQFVDPAVAHLAGGRSAAHIFDSYVPQAGHSTKGATGLVSLVQTRRTALP